jgi:acetyl esterase/lipase
MRFKILSAIALAAALGHAQDVIPLSTAAPEYPETTFASGAIVANISRSTLTVVKPTTAANGSGIVICPGGGFMFLSWINEGIDVAKFLAARGVTAFVLKYRVAHTGDNPMQEFQVAVRTGKFNATIQTVIPQSNADGLAAIAYVRKHAADWSLDPARIGIVGFSAGGEVAASAALHYASESRPAFAAPIYAVAGKLKSDPVPDDAPPLFVAAATDDSFGLAPDSVALYSMWLTAKKPAELHIYAKGGHGFGMRKQNLPSDEWANRFADWLSQQGFLKK